MIESAGALLKLFEEASSERVRSLQSKSKESLQEGKLETPIQGEGALDRGGAVRQLQGADMLATPVRLLLAEKMGLDAEEAGRCSWRLAGTSRRSSSGTAWRRSRTAWR